MPVEKSKSKLGFRTSALDLQEKFEDIFLAIGEKEKSWQEIYDLCLNEIKSAKEELEKSKDVMYRDALRNLILCLTTLLGISLLGTNVAIIENRIAELDKSIEKLNLKAK